MKLFSRQIVQTKMALSPAGKAKLKRNLKQLARRLRKQRSTVNVNRSLQPFAQRYMCKHKYAEVRSVAGPIGGGLVQYNWNLNSLYDPNLTGAGHQPYGYDQMVDLYNRYRVYKVDYVVSAYNSAADGTTASVIGVLPSNEPLSVSGGVSELMENPRAKYITQINGGGLKVLKGSISLPSLVGRSKAQYMADDRYQALATASPSEQAILNIMAGAISGNAGSGGTATNTMLLSISLVYHVEWFDAKIQLQS